MHVAFTNQSTAEDPYLFALPAAQSVFGRLGRSLAGSATLWARPVAIDWTGNPGRSEFRPSSYQPEYVGVTPSAANHFHQYLEHRSASDRLGEYLMPNVSHFGCCLHAHYRASPSLPVSDL